MTIPKKVETRDRRRMEKAEKAAMIDKVTLTVAHCLAESY